MRGLGGLILALASAVVLSSGAAAQDVVKPRSIQIVIDADGTVRVIDGQTGKAIATQIQAKPKTPQVDEAQQRLEEARKQLERVLGAQRERPLQPQPAPKAEAKPAPDGKPGVIVWQRPPADSFDKKLDLILQQLDELRRDVNQIKSRLDGKKPEAPAWQVVPRDKDKKPEIRVFQLKDLKDAKPGPIQIVPLPGTERPKEINPEAQKRLQYLLKKVELEQPKARPLPPQPSAEELDRELQRVIEQLQRLERQLRDKKSQR